MQAGGNITILFHNVLDPAACTVHILVAYTFQWRDRLTSLAESSPVGVQTGKIYRVNSRTSFNSILAATKTQLRDAD